MKATALATPTMRERSCGLNWLASSGGGLCIPHDPANHAAYAGSWVEALKKDKNEIFAPLMTLPHCRFVIALERGQSHSDALATVLGDRNQSVRGDKAATTPAFSARIAGLSRGTNRALELWRYTTSDPQRTGTPQ